MSTLTPSPEKPSQAPSPPKPSHTNDEEKSYRLNPTERAILWEVNLAQRCVDNFSKIIDAHAIVLSLLVTVTFVGFLQPPKGWNVNPQDTESYMFATSSVVAFTVFNSLSLYSAISGLLFYIYCSYSTVFTLGSVPLPERFDKHGMSLVHKLRSALRKVALPGVKRRATIFFGFLASSLFCCVAAYVCAGLAARGPSKSLAAAVILPAIPGCVAIIFLMLLAAAKMVKELEFDERLKMFWKVVKVEEPGIVKVEEPGILDLDEKDINALDPIPEIMRKLIKVVWPEKPRCPANPIGQFSSGGIPWKTLNESTERLP